MNAAYAASIATLAMRTATAVSKCVLTSPGSSTVLPVMPFCAGPKPQNRSPQPHSRPSNALCLSCTRAFGMNARLKDHFRLCTGFTQPPFIVASSVHLAVDWSRESSRWHRSQIPTSVDALFYTNNLSQVLDGRAAAASCRSATDGRAVWHAYGRASTSGARAINMRPSEPEAARNKNADGRRAHRRAAR